MKSIIIILLLFTLSLHGYESMGFEASHSD